MEWGQWFKIIALSGLYLRRITSRKQVGTQDWKRPNRDIKSSNSQNNWLRLKYVQSNWSSKKNKRNKSTYQYGNLSSCRTSDYYFSLSLQWFSWDLLGTKNVSSMHVQIFLESNKLWQQKSHRLCPREIINWLTVYTAENIIETQWLHVYTIHTTIESQETSTRQYP